MISGYDIRENTLTQNSIFLLLIKGDEQGCKDVLKELSAFCKLIENKVKGYDYVFELSGISDDSLLEKLRVKLDSLSSSVLIETFASTKLDTVKMSKIPEITLTKQQEGFILPKAEESEEKEESSLNLTGPSLSLEKSAISLRPIGDTTSKKTEDKKQITEQKTNTQEPAENIVEAENQTIIQYSAEELQDVSMSIEPQKKVFGGFFNKVKGLLKSKKEKEENKQDMSSLQEKGAGLLKKAKEMKGKVSVSKLFKQAQELKDKVASSDLMKQAHELKDKVASSDLMKQAHELKDKVASSDLMKQAQELKDKVASSDIVQQAKGLQEEFTQETPKEEIKKKKEEKNPFQNLGSGIIVKKGLLNEDNDNIEEDLIKEKEKLSLNPVQAKVQVDDIFAAQTICSFYADEQDNVQGENTVFKEKESPLDMLEKHVTKHEDISDGILPEEKSKENLKNEKSKEKVLNKENKESSLQENIDQAEESAFGLTDLLKGKDKEEEQKDREKSLPVKENVFPTEEKIAKKEIKTATKNSSNTVKKEEEKLEKPQNKEVKNTIDLPKIGEAKLPEDEILSIKDKIPSAKTEKKESVKEGATPKVKEDRIEEKISNKPSRKQDLKEINENIRKKQEQQEQKISNLKEEKIEEKKIMQENSMEVRKSARQESLQQANSNARQINKEGLTKNYTKIDHTLHISTPAQGIKYRSYPIEMPLIPTYTFANMDNSPIRFAHAMGIATLESLGGVNNPFLLQGASGTGKTHFLHAMGYEISKKIPQSKILFTNGVRFSRGVQCFLENGKKDKLDEFFKNVEVLIIDDIHLTAVNEHNREYISKVLNDFLKNKKQILLSSKYPPESLKRFEELVNFKLSMGAVAELKVPNQTHFLRLTSKILSNSSLDLQEAQVKEFFAERNTSLGDVARDVKRVKVLYRRIESSGIKTLSYEDILKMMTGIKGEDINSEIIKKGFSDITSLQKNKDNNWGNFGFFFPSSQIDKFRWVAFASQEEARVLGIRGGFNYALKSAYSTEHIISAAFKIANICDLKGLKGAVILGPSLEETTEPIRENFYDILTHMLEVMMIRCGTINFEDIKRPSAYVKLLGDILK